jgi:hypothetical protein
MKSPRDEVKSKPSERANFAEVRDQEVAAEGTTLTNELPPENKTALENLPRHLLYQNLDFAKQLFSSTLR